MTAAKAPISNRLLRYASSFLLTTVWGSALIFGLYILVYYALSYLKGDTTKWNTVLPGLYDPNNAASTAGIALHFLAGGLILMLGCVQLLEFVRSRYPMVHRVLGRVYVLASILVALGGLTFIACKGTIGGIVMDIGFGLYGLLMLLAAVLTFHFAHHGQLDRHRAWALRLFALAIASWLYRMDYAFYIGFGGREGHTESFTGWFDYLMDFAFYLPNLVVAEILIGNYALLRRPSLRVAAALLMLMGGALLLFATSIFVRDYWGPGIAQGL